MKAGSSLPEVVIYKITTHYLDTHNTVMPSLLLGNQTIPMEDKTETIRVVTPPITYEYDEDQLCETPTGPNPCRLRYRN